jgi:hypothetical protein
MSGGPLPKPSSDASGVAASVSEAVRREVWLWAKSGTRQWRRIWWAERLQNLIPLETRYRYWLIERPNYAYGVSRAVADAKLLGHSAVTIIEFGVAGGNGLLALERHAEWFSKKYDIHVDVVGFDRGKGMPESSDYRDQSFRWGAGYYEMDEVALRSRLTSAELVIGDVEQTVELWIDQSLERLRNAPIGFIAFDLDFWSSTMAAFAIFRRDSPIHLLPRVACYLDDLAFSIPSVGEMRAVSDFNEEAPTKRSIGQLVGLRAGIPFDPPWADQMYEAHFFTHPDYGRTVEPILDQFPLTAEGPHGAG